jgi:hypothetical protein
MMAGPGRKTLAATACVLLAGIALAALLHGGERAPGAPPAVMSAEATARSSDTATLRRSAEEIARRLGVRIVIDHAVRADLPAPRVPDGVLDAARLEAMLRQLLAGHPFAFHYGSDERLRAVWVYARDDHVAVRDAGSAAASVPPPAATTGPRGAPPAASHASTGESVAPAPDVQELRRIIEADASESARMQALDAYVVQAEASDEEVGALLERMSGSSHAMLAEHARVLQEARSAPTVLAPEPIE